MTPAKVVPSTSLLHQQLEMHAQKTLLGALIMLVVWDTLLYSWIKSNSHSIDSSLSLMSWGRLPISRQGAFLLWLGWFGLLVLSFSFCFSFLFPSKVQYH